MATLLKRFKKKMNLEFTGKVVLVTGSTAGIGEDAVISYAKLGAQVVVTGRDQARANEVAQLCKKVSPNGLNPLVIVADVSKEADCLRLIEETIATFKRLDVLVNNASHVAVTTLDDPNLLGHYDQSFQVNVRAPLQLIQLAAPNLSKTKGIVVNISSMSAAPGGARCFAYHMSKAALDLLTQLAAVELGPKGVRVVGVA